VSTVAVALGGVVGALARYALGIAWPTGAGAFPWTTFAVNVSGCLLVGVLLVRLLEAGAVHPLWRPFLGTGVLGGYTTFSTYAVDTRTLAAGGHPGVAVAYALGTLAAALLAVQVGVIAGRAVFRVGRGGT
jgi:fluoride exporter